MAKTAAKAKASPAKPAQNGKEKKAVQKAVKLETKKVGN